MKLVQKIKVPTDDTLSKYVDMFSGPGYITNVTHGIPTTQGLSHYVDKGIRRMGVRTYPKASDWVSSMVNMVIPNGKLHICIVP